MPQAFRGPGGPPGFRGPPPPGIARGPGSSGPPGSVPLPPGIVPPSGRGQ
jgi:hypothetical protein